MKIVLVLLVALLAMASAFIPPMPKRAFAASKPLFAKQGNLLTEAANCLGGECSVEDVSELVVQIRVAVKDMKEQVAALEALEAELSGQSKSTDQVKDIIKAVLRAMNVDPDDDNFPDIIRAAGFSGEPFKGKSAESFPQWKKA